MDKNRFAPILSGRLGGLLLLISGLCWLGSASFAGPPPSWTSCATPDTNIPITTCFFDLTESPSSTQTPKSAVLNNGIFRVPAYDGELGHGFIVGTGHWDPFVRIQERGNGQDRDGNVPNQTVNGIQAGYNTDGRDGNGFPAMLEMDNHDKGASNWNHAIRLNQIPKVTVCDGGGSTGANCKQYYEFLLDTNEQGNSTNAGISMDEFKVFTASRGDIHDFTGADDTKGLTNFMLTGSAQDNIKLRYDMDAGAAPVPAGAPNVPGSTGGDASILMDYRNFSGSGNGVDLQALVPVENFADAAADSFVYLYSKFGWTASMCKNQGQQDSPCKEPDGGTGEGRSISPSSAPTKAGSLDFQVDAGFEEWSIRKGPGGNTPVPATALLMLIALAGLIPLRRRASAA